MFSTTTFLVLCWWGRFNIKIKIMIICIHRIKHTGIDVYTWRTLWKLSLVFGTDRWVRRWSSSLTSLLAILRYRIEILIIIRSKRYSFIILVLWTDWLSFKWSVRRVVWKIIFLLGTSILQCLLIEDQEWWRLERLFGVKHLVIHVLNFNRNWLFCWWIDLNWWTSHIKVVFWWIINRNLYTWYFFTNAMWFLFVLSSHFYSFFVRNYMVFRCNIRVLFLNS